jgi:hypothetical protein
MLDGLFRFGTSFDWISPLLAIGQNIGNGPADTLMIPQACGWTGSEIVSLLKRHGVRTWGHMVVNDRFMINVRQSQARWARYVLQRAGLPGDEGAGPESATRFREARPPSHVREPRTAQDLGDMLKEFGDLRIF